MGWYTEQYKKGHKTEISQIKKVINNPFSDQKKVFESPDKIFKEIQLHIKNEKKIKFFKIIILLIPIFLIGFILYNNIFASHTFNYFYDIGENEKYLSPESRISQPIQEEINYRNLTASLVYFSVPIPRNAESIKIETKFKPKFPEDYVFILGAKDREDWHYKWNQLYNPSLNNISQFDSLGNVYLINKNLYVVPYDELKYERNVIIASDNSYTLLPNIITGYVKKNTSINHALRGGHTFYIYTEGDLDISIKKQDINWYPGEDILEVNLYDANEKIIGNFTIEDDGISEVSKISAPIQEKNYTIKNLEKGVYKMQLSNFDGLIKYLEVNTNKIVSNKLFLAGNSIYSVNKSETKLFLQTSRDTRISMRTWHYQGLQNISINNQSVPITQLVNATYFNATPGNYQIISEENDLILESTSYFAFNEENLFDPFKQTLIPIKNDVEWMTSNVDYLVTDYKKPKEENGWIIAETNFNIHKDNIFIKDNKVNFVFNAPHLSNPEYANHSIPVDWINVTVYKKGLL